MMNGGDMKKAAINKAKQVATAANNAANGNGGKKRRKGQDLKPIITTDGPQSAEPSPNTTVNSSSLTYVCNLYIYHAFLSRANAVLVHQQPTHR